MVTTQPNPETVKYLKDFLLKCLVKDIIKDIERLEQRDPIMARNLVTSLYNKMLPN